jgi:hypothetical protein
MNCPLCHKPIKAHQVIVMCLTDDIVLHKACLEKQKAARDKALPAEALISPLPARSKVAKRRT